LLLAQQAKKKRDITGQNTYYRLYNMYAKKFSPQ